MSLLRSILNFSYFSNDLAIDLGTANTLVTVRGRPHSPAVGAFVREARKHAWAGKIDAERLQTMVGASA